MDGIVAGLVTSPNPGFATLAVAMILIGIGFKVSAAPFQVWTPDVYEGAHSPVVALMSTGPKVAAFAVLLRILYGAYPALREHLMLLIWIMAALSIGGFFGKFYVFTAALHSGEVWLAVVGLLNSGVVAYYY